MITFFVKKFNQKTFLKSTSNLTQDSSGKTFTKFYKRIMMLRMYLISCFAIENEYETSDLRGSCQPK